MLTIQKKSLDSAIKILEALNCKYLIVDPDGNSYGELKAEPPKKLRSPPFYGKNVMRDHIVPHLKDLQVSGVAIIPTESFDPTKVQSSVCAWMQNNYGKGSYTTTFNKAQSAVEVLRIS